MPLLFILCRMTKFVSVFMHLIPVFFSRNHSNTIYLNARREYYCPICSLDLPIVRMIHRSVIMGMRGAKASVSPPRRSPLVCSYFILVTKSDELLQ